jgi:hypothetical protein
MRKLFFIAAMMIGVTSGYGQKSIDNLFDKYSGKNGFTTVTINGSLLKLVKLLDADSAADSDIPAGLTEIRILSQEDKSLNVGNFYDMVIKDIDLKDYEEFMRVKEVNQDLRMLVRTEGKRLKEFLMIAGGDDNAIIQIKGDLSFEDARKVADDARKNKGVEVLATQK